MFIEILKMKSILLESMKMELKQNHPKIKINQIKTQVKLNHKRTSLCNIIDCSLNDNPTIISKQYFETRKQDPRYAGI